MNKIIQKVGHKKLFILLIFVLAFQFGVILNRNSALGSKDFLTIQYTSHTIKQVISLLENEEVDQQEKEKEIEINRDSLSLSTFFGSSSRTNFLYSYSDRLFMSKTQALLARDQNSLEQLKEYHELLEELLVDLERYDQVFQTIGRVIPHEIIDMNYLGTYYYFNYRESSIEKQFDTLREAN